MFSGLNKHIVIFWIVLIISTLRLTVFLVPKALLDILGYGGFLWGLLYGIVYFGQISKKIKVLTSIAAFYIAYLLLVESYVLQVDSLLYFFSRLGVLFLISSAIVSSPHYFTNRFVSHLAIFMLICVILSLIVYTEQNGRFAGIYTNANAAGASFAVGLIALSFYNSRRQKWIFYIGILLSTYTIFLTQSRGALIAVVIVFGGLIYRKFPQTIFLGIVGLLIFIMLGLNLNSIAVINRISDEGLWSGRESETETSFYRISQKPYSGWGYANYHNTMSGKIFLKGHEDALGAHNSYLEFYEMFGYFFGTIFIIIILIPFIRYARSNLKNWLSGYSSANFYIVLGFYLFLHNFFESFFKGINHFVGFVFWIALLMISYLYHNHSRSRIPAKSVI